MSSRWNRTIYVGNLPGDIRMREVEDLFYKVFIFLFSCNYSLISFVVAILIGAYIYIFVAVRTNCGH